jgi:hypothetical protein
MLERGRQIATPGILAETFLIKIHSFPALARRHPLSPAGARSLIPFAPFFLLTLPRSGLQDPRHPCNPRFDRQHSLADLERTD